jgi:hypothetical protein
MNDVKIITNGISLKQSAIIAGIGLIFMTILGPVANFMIVQGLIVPGDAAGTVANITASMSTFRLGIVLFLAIALLDILVAWALFIFLVPVNKYLSLLTAWLRIIYATLLLVSLFFLLRALLIINGTGSLTDFTVGQQNSMVLLSIEVFNSGWAFGLIIFGFHLLLLGYLFFKAGFMRKILGILIILAALGYIIDGLGKVLSENYHLTMSMYTFIGEVVLLFWLLIRGRKVTK